MTDIDEDRKKYFERRLNQLNAIKEQVGEKGMLDVYTKLMLAETGRTLNVLINALLKKGLITEEEFNKEIEEFNKREKDNHEFLNKLEKGL